LLIDRCGQRDGCGVQRGAAQLVEIRLNRFDRSGMILNGENSQMLRCAIIVEQRETGPCTTHIGHQHGRRTHPGGRLGILGSRLRLQGAISRKKRNGDG